MHQLTFLHITFHFPPISPINTLLRFQTCACRNLRRVIAKFYVLSLKIIMLLFAGAKLLRRVATC